MMVDLAREPDDFEASAATERPRGSPLIALIREDLRSHGSDWTRPGFRAIAVYRFGVWRMDIRPKLLRAPLSIFYRLLFRYVRNRYGIELPYSAQIGRRVVIEHQSGIVVHGATVIGDDCTVRQNCTFGIKNKSDATAAPILGDRVDVGAGAVVLGRVRIGDDAVIGANAVVLIDVPAGALAVGVPAAIKRR
ncbi:serine O-acetyltransferase [Sphingomonas hankyongi]|uniref:Serine acetyltransferase n=1 Tax=Sphingomonas hankyongi TaxID=2908209 RepID=A0ABT0S2N9_9SPHN|nr:serine acetyltransferase [Sphingomonas hankyongi]MCL6730128.1 serine acetyltransferase [Sphingomonas hankyongi]